MNEASAATILHSDEVWTCARFRNVLIVVWKKDTEVTRVKKADAASRALADVHAATGGIGMVVVVEPGTRLPGQEARREMVAGMRAWGPHVRAMACVVPASGFSGSAARAVLNSMMLLARATLPIRTFAGSQEASAWAAAGLGGTMTAEELCAAVEEARRLV